MNKKSPRLKQASDLLFIDVYVLYLTTNLNFVQFVHVR